MPTTTKAEQQLIADIAAFYAAADPDLRPDLERAEHMAHELYHACLTLETATVDQLNRLALGERLRVDERVSVVDLRRGYSVARGVYFHPEKYL